MNRWRCRFETEVVRAARNAEIPAALSSHIASCSVCTTALRVASLFALDREKEAAAEEATAVWQRSRAVAAFAAPRRSTQQVQLLALARLGTVGIAVTLVVVLGEVTRLALPVDILPSANRSLTAYAAAVLLVGAGTLVSLWRRLPAA